jgi:ribosomal protein L15
MQLPANQPIHSQERLLGMSDATVSGVIHLIEETKTYGSKGFRKRLVVLEQDKGSFTNYVPIEFTRDGCDAVDELNVGDEIEVAYRLSGRRWQKDEKSEAKYFVNVEALSFKLLGSGTDTMTENVTSNPNDAFAEAAEEDEAPF